MIFDKIQLVEELINISIEEDLKDGDPSSEIIYSNPQLGEVNYITGSKTVSHLKKYQTRLIFL